MWAACPYPRSTWRLRRAQLLDGSAPHCQKLPFPLARASVLTSAIRSPPLPDPLAGQLHFYPVSDPSLVLFYLIWPLYTLTYRQFVLTSVARRQEHRAKFTHPHIPH